MTMFPLPFAIRTDYEEGESLASLMARLVDLNFYESPNTPQLIVSDFLKKQQIRDNPLLPRHSLTFSLLEALTEISQSTHHQSTVHCFAPIVQRPTDKVDTLPIDGSTLDVPIMSESYVNKHVRATNVAAFCPQCLSEKKIHRTGWMLSAVTVCLEHETILHNRCPVCRQDLTVTEIVHNCCSCGFTLSDTDTSEKLDVARLNAHRTMHSWLGLPTSTTNLGLPDVAPRILFDVLHGLRLCVEHSRGQITREEIGLPDRTKTLWDIVDILDKRDPRDPEWLFYTYAFAFQIMTDWPYNFQAFLKKLSRRTKRGLHGLGTIYTQWIASRWLHPEYQFLQNEFERFLYDAMFPSISKVSRYSINSPFFDKQTYILPSHAMMLLRVSTRTLDTLVEHGVLSYIPLSEKRGKSAKMLKLSEVEKLKRTWDAALTLRETCEAMGVSEKTAVELISLKMITAIRGVPVDGSAEWLIDPMSVRLCQMSILGSAQKVTDLEEGSGRILSLATATQRCASFSLSLAKLLMEIARGRLRAFYVEDQLKDGMRALRVGQSDLDQFIEQVRIEYGWLGRKEIAQLMGVKEIVAARWIEHGLLYPANPLRHSRTLYFDKFTVDWFVGEHFFTEEAADVLQLSPLTVQKWARGGRLHPIAGPGIDECHRYLFTRDEIERFRPENRLTAPQAARLLGIDPSHIINLVRQGSIKAVSGPGIDQMGQYLFLRSEILRTTWQRAY